ncbi:circadian clock-controlled protein-like [Ostrinia furnacalis]|uniref:circadian clock-controlled protein-like n=1 Tax=Ostrinia furnacalis TaxID=93504 RepID=UPI00103CB806|nr:circadian clock-controlled protein-like [Ostrinia furnacalis]
MFSIITILVLCSFCAVQSGVLPVDKCKLTDSTCMVPAFQKAVPIFMAGLPDMDVAVLDVMEMDDIKFDLSGLQFSLTEGRLKGLKTAVIDNVKWSEKKKKFEVDFHVNCNIKGHYTAGGRILILPITGDGQITLKLKNIVVKFFVDYDIEKNADGDEIVVPKKYDFQFEVKDGAHFTMTNLFNGNKELSDTMHTFLNENWKQIATEFGRPIMGSAANTLFKNVSNFFKKSPIKDIAELVA